MSIFLEQIKKKKKWRLKHFMFMNVDSMYYPVRLKIKIHLANFSIVWVRMYVYIKTELEISNKVKQSIQMCGICVIIECVYFVT